MFLAAGSYDVIKYKSILLCRPIHIQGDSGGICNTLGNDSMCDSKQKSSYGHGSDFERLPKNGKKKIGTSCDHKQQLRNK